MTALLPIKAVLTGAIKAGRLTIRLTLCLLLIPVLSVATARVWSGVLVLLSRCWLVGRCLRILWPLLVTCHFIEILTVRIVVLTVPIVLLGRAIPVLLRARLLLIAGLLWNTELIKIHPLLIDT